MEAAEDERLREVKRVRREGKKTEKVGEAVCAAPLPPSRTSPLCDWRVWGACGARKYCARVLVVCSSWVSRGCVVCLLRAEQCTSRELARLLRDGGDERLAWEMSPITKLLQLLGFAHRRSPALVVGAAEVAV